MKRILLIEDNIDHVELIQSSLQAKNQKIDVVLARSAREAYQILTSQRFDLILSDYYLVGVSGDSHLKQLKTKAPHTPIVVITGQGDEKTAAQSIKAGAEDYIVKTREVLEALPEILKRLFVQYRQRTQEMRTYLVAQKNKAKLCLGEVNTLDRRMHSLRAKKRKLYPNEANLLEQVSIQLQALKKTVASFFKKSKLNDKKRNSSPEPSTRIKRGRQPE